MTSKKLLLLFKILVPYKIYRKICLGMRSDLLVVCSECGGEYEVLAGIAELGNKFTRVCTLETWKGTLSVEAQEWKTVERALRATGAFECPILNENTRGGDCLRAGIGVGESVWVDQLLMRTVDSDDEPADWDCKLEKVSVIERVWKSWELFLSANPC